MMNFKNSVLLLVLLIVINFGFSQSICLLNSEKKLSQYKISSWTTNEGLPSERVSKIVQTSDGYLWFATFSGLCRFDGVAINTYTFSNTPSLASNSIQTITEDKNHTLWIGTLKGISIYKNGKFSRNSKLDTLKDVIINELFSDKEGNLWIGTSSAGIYKFTGDTLIHYPEFRTVTKNLISTIFTAENNQIYIGTEAGELIVFNNNGFQLVNIDDNPGSINSVCVRQNGDVWIAASNGLYLKRKSVIVKMRDVNVSKIKHILEDQNKMLWMATENGLYRYSIKNNAIDFIDENKGLPNNLLTYLLFDNEGNLWAGTYRKGFLSLTDGPFFCYSTFEGLNTNLITGISQINDTSYLLGNENGFLNIIKNNRIFDNITQLPIQNIRLKHIFTDSRKNIWFSTYGGLLKMTDSKIKVFNVKSKFPDDFIRLVFEDSKGNIYVGTRSSGIHVFADNDSYVTIDQNTGLSSNYIMSITEDKMGNIVVGTKNGLTIIKDFKIEKIYSTKNGFPSDFSFNTYVDKNNTYWICTSDGMIRLKNEIATQFTINDGLIDNSVFDILEDNYGYFWLPNGLCISRISKQELEDYADGKIKKLNFQNFNESNGIKKAACIGATKSIIDKQGRLWFLTLGGLVSVDAKDIVAEKSVPDVKIETITSDSICIDLNETTIIPSGIRRFQIKYTAFDYSAAEKLKFRYRMKPFETAWHEAGNERVAQYTNLSPGDYIFEIVAANKDGVWGSNITVLNIEIKPLWYQTWIVRIAMALVVIGIIFSIFKYRTFKIRKQKEELEKLVKERTIEVEQQKEELMVQAENLQQANEEINAKSESLKEQNDKLQIAYDNVNLLSEIGQKITSNLNTRTIIRIVYQSINNLMDASVFTIGIYNDVNKSLDFEGTIEKGEELPYEFDLLSDECFSALCYKTQTPIFISDMWQEYNNYFTKKLEPKVGDIPESLIYLPLTTIKNKIGVISVQSFRKKSYTRYHLNILQNIAIYTAIALENAETFHKIDFQNMQIKGSINYALNIQQAILPHENEIDKYFDHFLIYKPKDIVSGDFYWMQVADKVKFNLKNDYIFAAAVDCTGHGVPGAFMSLIGNRLLNEIVKNNQYFDTADILTQLNLEISKALNQDKTDNIDGMDVSLCRIEQLSNTDYQVQYSGSKRPLYYFKQNGDQIAVLSGSNISIGGTNYRNKSEFQSHILNFTTTDIIYLSTDGFIDQNAEDRKRYGTPRLIRILEEIKVLPMKDQKSYLIDSLNKWMQDTEQRDDITFWGLKFR